MYFVIDDPPSFRSQYPSLWCVARQGCNTLYYLRIQHSIANVGQLYGLTLPLVRGITP